MTIDDVDPAPAGGADGPVRPSVLYREWDPWRRPEPRADEFSGFAVASFVFGLLGGLLGVVFGIIALVRIRKTGQRGRWLAITGMVLTGVWTVAGGIVVTTTVHGAGASAGVRALKVGDCFNRPETGPGTGFATPITSVACTRPHNAETIGWVSAADGPRTAYPGAAALARRAESGCRDIGRNYVLDPLSLPPGTQVRWYLPRAAEWRRPDNAITCFLASEQAPADRSLRLDTAVVNADQLRFLMALRDRARSLERLDALGPTASWPDLRAAVSAVADAQVTLWVQLKAGPWPGAAQPAIDRLVQEIDAAATAWKHAAAATGEADLRERVSRAKEHTGNDAEVAARRALGLPATQGEPFRRP
jgi:hypothetical protein